jgi:2-oxoglutarate dehydrogenase E2 component (dihydrolipoamide succinyltransferase)/2-oxoisovalerate dehydrogenase E2 component (dihydrolipoyl transacylase)
MAVDIIMPQMGESVVEGTIVHWLVKEGDKVRKDQPIVEISTDKVDTEVPAPTSGTIKTIVHKEDEIVPVKTVIAILETADVDIEETTPTDKPVAVEEKEINRRATSVAVSTDDLQTGKRYSPLVRRMAREYRIDPGKVKGTGAGGRVTKQDILDYVKRKPEYEPPDAAEENEAEGNEEIIPISPKRKIIADRMSESKRTAAHVTTTFEVDMSKIAKYREEHKGPFLKSEKLKLTYLPFIVLNTARALKQHPVFNASWSDKGIVVKKQINIGMAVSLDDGLIVPVIKSADKKGLVEIARTSQDLAQRARNKGLKPEEVQYGTFTITNYGANGSLFGTPVILLPQVAILGLGAITKRPVVINDAIAIRHMMYLSLSFDHRVVDVAQADKFLITIKEGLEGWEQNIHEKMPGPETGFGGIW